MLYFTSDLHFNHANIIEYCDRPFSGVTEMNEALIDNWNSTVNDDDTVYVLGDVCMGKIEDSLALLPRLKGFKRLIPGNHDRCWVGNGNKHKAWIARYEAVGFNITAERHITHNGYFFLLDHFPYHGDSGPEERYEEFRPKDTGCWLLHGHVHDAWAVNGRQINVGVDVNNYRPISLDDLVKLREFYS